MPLPCCLGVGLLFATCFLILEGLVLYFLGGFLYFFTKYKHFGHHLVAISGFWPRWLASHCPYTPGQCNVWNCPNFHKCGGDR